jgi:2-dehydro-3-deoxyphosphogluconate aldolase/(4S)-4-hydroxy-2-oxoglutarate aldolase
MKHTVSNIEEIMLTSPVIPVIVIDDIDDAVPMAQALVNGGLKVLEVTLRTDFGLEAISKIKQQVSGAIVGAGTVISSDDLEKSVAVGAEFLVSPGCTDILIDAALKGSIPLLPGVATPSEAMALLNKGVSHMKFFPAQAAGGIPMLRSIAGPLPQIKFCPTGGITETNAADFLALSNVLCVGGTWMLDKTLIANKDWAAIEKKACAAAQISGHLI